MRRSRFLLGCVTALGLALPGFSGPLPAVEAGGAEVPPGVPDAKTKKAIDAAVEKGAEWLRGQQLADGSFGGIGTTAGVRFEIGHTALMGLALLAANEGKPDPAVDKALAYCRAKDAATGGARTTYDTGVLLMFATEYHRSGAAKNSPKKGSSRPKKDAKDAKAADGCNLPEDVRFWVQVLVDHLSKTRKEPGTWGYPTLHSRSRSRR
jgi:hypothetical protein